MSCEKLRRTIVDQEGAEWHACDRRQTAAIEWHQTNLFQQGYLDFDGIVLAALRLIEEHAWVRSAIQAKFPILVIDEYQDLGLPLHRMVLKLLSTAEVRVIAVGDPDQSIYGFTGAQPGLLRTLAELPYVETIRLALNYRCGTQIIRASHALLNTHEPSRSHDGRHGHVEVHKVGGAVGAQAKYAFDTLVPRLCAEHPHWQPGDLAILYASFREGDAIAEAADQRAIHYFRQDNGSPIKRTPLMNWLCEAARWCAGGWQDGSVLMSDLVRGWRALRPSLSSEQRLSVARNQLIHTLFSLREGNARLLMWLQQMAERVLEDMFVAEISMGDERETFDALLLATGTGRPLEPYTVAMFGSGGRSVDRINMMTLHSAKGLEFEAVIIVGVEMGDMPNRYCKSQEERDEAARLFYVGLTRAKQQVHVLYSSHPSPFIQLVLESGDTT